MAVYTEVGDEALARFLERLRPRRAVVAEGHRRGRRELQLPAARRARRILLTLYEKRVDEADLPFFLGLMEHLARRGVNCPQPVRASDGAAVGRLAGRPAAIVTFLEGLSVRRPTAEHCGEVGEALARMHAAGADFALKRVNALSIEGWPPLFEAAARAGRRGRARAGARDRGASSPRCRQSGRRRCRPASSTPTCSPTTCSSSATSCRG